MSGLFTMTVKVANRSHTIVEYQPDLGAALDRALENALTYKKNFNLVGPVSIEVKEDTSFGYLYGG